MSGAFLDLMAARRLALARAGLLKPEWTNLATKVGTEAAAKRAAHAVIGRFGYLQLDSVSVAGARSHAIVLLSRLEGLPVRLGEELLAPGAPLFEYWAHEACWLPLELYPFFGFRREESQKRHPWWGDLIGQHPEIVRTLLERIEKEGKLRSTDLEGERGASGWWNLKTSKKVAEALWMSGRLAIVERRNFLRSYDLVERVIPEAFRRQTPTVEESLERLFLQALDGHGWATPGTIAATWRLRNRPEELKKTLDRLLEKGEIAACRLKAGDRELKGFIRPADLELAERLRALRPRNDRGVLLSPFDPVLWDRARVALLFNFELVIEIYKRPEQRRFGYYSLPILAGERLIGRVDLKADRGSGVLAVRNAHFESPKPSAAERAAQKSALERFARGVGLALET